MICSDKKETKNAGKLSNRGSVIFIVLVFIISVTTLVLISTMHMTSEVDFLDSEFNRLHAYTMCLSGMEFLKNRLSTGLMNANEFVDVLDKSFFPRLMMDGRDITIPMNLLIKPKFARYNRVFRNPDIGFILNIQDSAGLINFFRVDKNLLRNLFVVNDIPPERAEEVMDSLMDWMDPDSFKRPNGAESAYYMNTYGYPAANRIIDSNDQILQVKGVDKDIYNRIGHLLDFNIENRGVNPNTMPREAFQLFPGLSERNIDRIIEQREQKPFAGPAEITLLGGYNFNVYPTSLQFFTSNTTYVTIKASMNEKRFFYIRFRMDRIGGGGGMRSSRQAGFAKPRKNPYVDFSQLYNFYNWHEGTRLIEEEYER